MAVNEEELKSLLMKVKEESEKVGLKLNYQKTKIMASGPITSWQIDGETMETVTDFLRGRLQNHCRWWLLFEIKRCLLLGRKTMRSLDSILKRRDITLPTNVHLVKAVVFPVVMYGCESWTIKKAEGWRIDTFELWCWRILLSPLDCEEIKPVSPKGNQYWLFTGETDSEAETLNTSATWCEKLIHWKNPWCWDRVKKKRGWQRMRRLDGVTDSMDISLSSSGRWGTGKPGVLQFVGLHSQTWLRTKWQQRY